MSQSRRSFDEWSTLSELLRFSFLHTYVLSEQPYDYQIHPLTLAFAFLGFQTRMLDGDKQSWANIGKNLIGWQSEAPAWKKVINGGLAPFALVFNLALAVPKCAINIVKLVTEFSPSVLGRLFARVVEKTHSIFEHNGDFVRGGNIIINNYYSPEVVRNAKVAWFFANIGAYFLLALRFIGRAITSPLENAQYAFKLGQKLAGEGAGGKMLGVVLAGFSTIITLGFYIFAAPIALNFVATTIFPGLATTLPTFLNTIGNFLQPAANAVYGWLGLSSISMAHVGLSALVAAAITTLGHGVFALKDLIVDKWYERKSKQADQVPYHGPRVDWSATDVNVRGILNKGSDDKKSSVDAAQVYVASNVPGINSSVGPSSAFATTFTPDPKHSAPRENVRIDNEMSRSP